MYFDASDSDDGDNNGDGASMQYWAVGIYLSSPSNLKAVGV